MLVGVAMELRAQACLASQIKSFNSPDIVLVSLTIVCAFKQCKFKMWSYCYCKCSYLSLALLVQFLAQCILLREGNTISTHWQLWDLTWCHWIYFVAPHSCSPCRSHHQISLPEHSSTMLHAYTLAHTPPPTHPRPHTPAPPTHPCQFPLTSLCWPCLE
jgi:hypothetical protein